MCPCTPSLNDRKKNITSLKPRVSWNATNANTCAQGEVSLGEPHLTIYIANGLGRGKVGVGGV